ncbi:MAG: glycosyltransferase family 4 protein, partial [Thermoplasmata archaeon]
MTFLGRNLVGKRLGVLHSTFLTSGGIERMPLMHALKLSEKNEVTVFCTMYDKEKCFPELMKKLKVKRFFYDIPFPKVRRSINHFAAYVYNSINPRKFANFDLLLCNHQPSIWLGYRAKRRYGVPYIYYAQGISRELYPREVDLDVRKNWDKDRAVPTGLFSKISHFKKIDMKSVREAVSKKIAKEIEDVFGIEGVKICYPCVDVDKFKRYPEEETKGVIDKFRIRRPFILTTNRHEAHKKLDWLIDMMKIVAKEYAESTLVITGKKNDFYTPFLEKKIKDSGLEKNVILTNEITDQELVSLYNQADVYVYSPPEEDFGLGPIEAMSCGTVPIAWNSAGPKESIIDGEN